MPFISKLKSLDSSFYKSVLDAIPDDWKPANDDFSALLSFLTNRDPNKVLEAVKNTTNKMRVFPNWNEDN